MVAKLNSNETVRLGFTGVGGRGSHLLDLCLEIDSVEIPAICDKQDRHRKRAARDVEQSGRPKPETFVEYDRLLDRTDLDGVIIATSWSLHIPMAIEAMDAGITPAIEVGPAATIEECWDLIRAAEETGVHCMLLENCCYYRDCLAILSMVRGDVFGELIHCRCGYGHDLRELITTKSKTALTHKSGLSYRGVHNEKRNGDIYPTHGIGPMAKCLDVNRGNRFVSLTSVDSKSRGLQDWTENNLDESHPSREIDWAMGDVITTTIRCANGETIVVTHDVGLPRPYSNMYHVQGTNGLWKRDAHPYRDEVGPYKENEQLGRVHIEGQSPAHVWEPFDEYYEEYEHPMWKSYQEEGVRQGHGGTDYLMLYDLVRSIQRGSSPPIDEYDAATWMAITPLTERSISLGSEPVEFPDFTTGEWIHDRQSFGVFGDQADPTA